MTTLNEGKSVRLRSPITCKDPCCVKCYGTDLQTGKDVKVGRAVGPLAADAITEQCTQLTMKNFQSGGVVGKTNLSSDFNALNDLFSLKTLFDKDSAQSYDVIAPVDASTVETTTRGDGSVALSFNVECKVDSRKGDVTMNAKKYLPMRFSTASTRYCIPHESQEKINRNVRQGASVYLDSDTALDLFDLGFYRSPRAEQVYIVLRLYDMFRNQVFVNIKHFEAVVSGLSLYICTRGNGEYKSGCCYTVRQKAACKDKNVKFTLNVYNVLGSVLNRSNIFESSFLERFDESIPKHIIFGGMDELVNPLTRIALGIPSRVGSDVPGYLKE